MGSRQFSEFSYKPVPPLAPISLFFGILSLFALLSIFALPICLFGIVLSVLCLFRIRRSNGEFSGSRLALIGLALSFVFLISGSVWHSYVIATEVPEGCERVDFTRDISRKGFIFEDGVKQVHPDVDVLNGKRIFVKGYMYPTGQTEGITSFVLVKDNQQCCFGGQPKTNDMILVNIQDEKTVNYWSGLVSVGGVFQSQTSQNTSKLKPVYELKGFYFSEAKTSF